MKQLILIITTILCCSFTVGDTSQETSSGITVYICTGPKSKRYHCDQYCKGLRSCSKDVIAVSLEKARKMGRTPCKWCYELEDQ